MAESSKQPDDSLEQQDQSSESSDSKNVGKITIETIATLCRYMPLLETTHPSLVPGLMYFIDQCAITSESGDVTGVVQPRSLKWHNEQLARHDALADLIARQDSEIEAHKRIFEELRSELSDPEADKATDGVESAGQPVEDAPLMCFDKSGILNLGPCLSSLMVDLNAEPSVYPEESIMDLEASAEVTFSLPSTVNADGSILNMEFSDNMASGPTVDSSPVTELVGPNHSKEPILPAIKNSKWTHDVQFLLPEEPDISTIILDDAPQSPPSGPSPYNLATFPTSIAVGEPIIKKEFADNIASGPTAGPNSNTVPVICLDSDSDDSVEPHSQKNKLPAMKAAQRIRTSSWISDGQFLQPEKPAISSPNLDDAPQSHLSGPFPDNLATPPMVSNRQEPKLPAIKKSRRVRATPCVGDRQPDISSRILDDATQSQSSGQFAGDLDSGTASSVDELPPMVESRRKRIFPPLKKK